MSEPTPLDDYIEDLQTAVTNARLSYEIWWAILGNETNPSDQKNLNRFNLFFGPTANAHFLSCLVLLYRIFETRKDTISFMSLLRQARGTGRITDDKLSELKQAYEFEAKPLWIKVSVLRNNAYGHRNSSKSVTEIFGDADLAPGDLKDLIKITELLLNKFTSAYRNSSHAFNGSAKKDTILLFKAIRRENGS